MSSLLLLALAAAPSGEAAVPPPSPLITREAITGPVRFLASDLLEGRAPGTRGEALTLQYLASSFEALGLAPAGDDRGYVQRVPLVGVTGGPAELEVELPKGPPVVLRQPEEVMVVPGRPAANTTLAGAELVFVGYGITAPEHRWDDYKGVDVTGKVVVVLNSDPDRDPALFGGRARLWYGRWDYKFLEAQRRGAAGCLVIHTTASAGYPWQVVVSSWSGEQLDVVPPSSNLTVKGWLTEAATRRLFAASGTSLDQAVARAQTRQFRPVPLGARVSTRFDSAVVRREGGNVLGILPGRDRSLAGELVVLTAHHDHLGTTGPAEAGTDTVYNGAVDNASGVAALLAVARAMAALPQPPRRSVLFASVTAEEQGLLGSQYLVAHPPVPVERMVANLNIDGLNIWGRTRDVTVIGLGKSSLDGLIGQLARLQGRVVRADGMADRGFFYRSDQFNFARAGIPAAYFSSGQDFVGRPAGWGKERREQWEARHYHQVSDHFTEEWDLSGAVEDVQLYFQLAVMVANAAHPPAWTRGDEFERVRGTVPQVESGHP